MSAVELRKAAILLSSLPEPLAGKLLARLALDELKCVVDALARLAEVSRAEQASVILEFTERVAARAARTPAA